MIEVVQAGLCDLVMDLGRPGWALVGVPAGGAADPVALAAANRLVGNEVAAAGLEIALRGPTLRFPRGAVVALTGARFKTTRSSHGPVAWNETMVMAPGETLRLEFAQSGCRCWLAVRGGVRVEPVMGSCSTFLPSGFGGQQGRALIAGDTLGLGAADGEVRLRRAMSASDDQLSPLRVVAGPQIDWFGDRGLAAFFNGCYQVAPASDRRGVRLSGLSVEHQGADLPSQGVLPGAVQVPPDGQPIVLGWDGPVTGGYPVIATVIAADWGRLAQLKPGDDVRFRTVEIDVARRLAGAQWEIEDL